MNPSTSGDPSSVLIRDQTEKEEEEEEDIVEERVENTAHREIENLKEDNNNTKDNDERLLYAISLYHKASKLEQEGKVYDALNFYRRAVHMEPDIEIKYYEKHKCKCKSTAQNGPSSSLIAKAKEETAASRMDMRLYEKFQNDICTEYNGRLMQSDRNPNVICTATKHISDLPSEIITHILSFVISSHLDMRSLEQCAAVCKGFYVCARDQNVWRKACEKMWEDDLGTLTEENSVPVSRKLLDDEKVDDNLNELTANGKYTSWRQMYIERPKIYFNGCYIGKCSYLRLGENSFQDQYYRPIQLVDYYRCVRFRPDGSCYMLTTTEAPRQAVTRLENIVQIKPEVLRGQYRIDGTLVSLYFSKSQQYRIHNRKFTSKSKTPTSGCTYYMQFRIHNVSRRKFGKLVWLKYSMTHSTEKRQTSSDFNVSSSRFPPLWFTPVPTYNAQAEEPLF